MHSHQRFLRGDWGLLKDVVNIILDGILETRPGMQDFACETFLQLCRMCAREFVVIQARSSPHAVLSAAAFRLWLLMRSVKEQTLP